ncbi:ubiquitin-like domain-containing protein, partial [Caerostris darwini]
MKSDATHFVMMHTVQYDYDDLIFLCDVSHVILAPLSKYSKLLST